MLQAFPQLGLVLLGPQGRREDVLGALEAGPGQLVLGEEEVLRAGLRKRRQAAVPCLAHLVQRVLRGKVNDVDGHLRDLRHGDGAMHGLRLRLRGPGESMVDGRRLSLRKRPGHDHVDHAPVLRVHADERAVLRRLGKGLEDRGIIHHEDVRVGHEKLEAGNPFTHQVIHVLEAGFPEVRDDHVEAVIDARPAFRLFPPGVQGLPHPRAPGLDGEIDDGRGAAERRGPCPGLEVIRGGGAAEGHVQVRVGVNAAGDHVEAGSLDDLVRGLCGNPRADFLDALSVDQDVRAHGVFRGDDRPISNQRCCHTFFPPYASPGFAYTRPASRWAWLSFGLPVGTSTIVMHCSTGQTSEHKLHPTHSSSSTWGTRSPFRCRCRATRARNPASRSGSP